MRPITVSLLVRLYIHIFGDLFLLLPVHLLLLLPLFRTVTAYELEDRGSISVKFGITGFFLFIVVEPGLGSTQPATEWMPASLSPAVRRPECDAPIPSADVNNEWNSNSTPPHANMAWYLIDARTDMPSSWSILYHIL